MAINSENNNEPNEKIYLVFLGLISFCLVIYSNSLFNGFVYDDLSIVVNDYNKDLKNVINSFWLADTVFTDDVGAYYRPLNRITYILEYYFFGFNAKWAHLFNVVIHALNTVLLYCFSKLLFKEKSIALFASLLFLVHPVNAEAVNFISARNTLLSTSFFLLSCLCYVAGFDKKKVVKYIWAAVFVFLGLLCKETALMAVPLLFLFNWPSSFSFKGVLTTRATPFTMFFLSIAAYLCLRSYVLSGLVTNISGGKNVFERVFDNVYILPKYLSLLVLPLDLQCRHELPQNYADHLLLIIPVWLIILFSTYIILRHGSASHRFCFFWFLINYIPISGIVAIPSAPLAERFIYLPAIGIWLLLASGLHKLITNSYYEKVYITISVLVLIALSVTTFQRNQDWKDDQSLFTSLVEANPLSIAGHFNLGRAYLDKGNHDKAYEHWATTVKLDPLFSKGWNHLGNLAFLKNDLKGAEFNYQKALSADKRNAETHYNLALIMEQTGRMRRALYHYQVFLQRVPVEHAYLTNEIKAKVRVLSYQLEK